MRILILAAVLALAGCATRPELVGAASDRAVVYDLFRDDAAAQAVADKACGAYGKHAQLLDARPMQWGDHWKYQYACVYGDHSTTW